MILINDTGTENNPLYQQLALSNGKRQYDFLKSITELSIASGRPFLSSRILKALNFHAIVCLHESAGEYRPCEVSVVSGTDAGGETVYEPPAHYKVQGLMDDFINRTNRAWGSTDVDPVVLAAFVLWQIAYIHPFINGNGRTARAACYFVLCASVGRWLPGKTILPDVLKNNRSEYIDALRKADASHEAGNLDLTLLHNLLQRLLREQLNG